MKLEKFAILGQVIPIFVPYVILYSIYIQLNGEVSPGGGFQAGVIFASGVIAVDLIWGFEKLQKMINITGLVICGFIGVALYGITGLLSFIVDANYLDYSVIMNSNIAGQHLGIFLVELGVGITVSSMMMLIYFVLKKEV